MPHHVAVFSENKPGKLEGVTNLLADQGVNIRAITIADSGDFGVIKLLVDDPKKAVSILTAQGMVAVLKAVVAARITDQPGGLLTIARTLNKHKINVDDAYGFVLQSGQTGVFVIQVAKPEEASRLLREAGIKLLEEKDLYYL